MNKVLKGVVIGALGGGAISWYRAYKNGEPSQDAMRTAAKTGAAYGAAGGLVVGLFMQRRSKAKLTKRAAAQLRVRELAGQAAAAAVAAGELARPRVEEAMKKAKPYAKEAGRRARRYANEARVKAQPAIEQAIERAVPIAKQAGEKAAEAGHAATERVKVLAAA